jgi:biotin transport system substrate-specific component
MTTQTLAISSVSTRSRVLWILGFAILTGLSSLVRVPLWFTPIPITLQTAVVLLSGLVLGRDGFWSQLVYLALGCVGLPFFTANSSNVQTLFGATGGYLIGFVFASAFVGYMIQPQWRFLSAWRRFVYLLAASMLILIPGVIQLKLVSGVSLARALEMGFYPFILGDFIKTLLVTWVPKQFIRK